MPDIEGADRIVARYVRKNSVSHFELIERDPYMLHGTEISGRAIDLVESMMNGGHLPVLNDNANEICAITGDSNTCVADLAAVIMRDCGMTSNILTTTNSSLYCPRQPIKTVSAAVSFLGFHRIRTLVLGLELFREGAKNARSRNLMRLYANSYFAGSFAQSLARKIGYSEPEEIFIAGLLSQLPSMALANNFPEKFREMEDLIAEGTVDMNKACVVVFGCAYTDICRALAQVYRIPGKVHDILAGEKRNEEKMFALVETAVLVSRFLFSEASCDPDCITKAEEALREITGQEDFAIGEFIRQACADDENIGRFFNLADDDIDIMVRILEWGKASPSRIMSGITYQDEAEAEENRDPESQIGHFITELHMAQKNKQDINHILMLAQEGLFRCITDSHVILAFVDFKKNTLQGKFYAGSHPVVKATDFHIKCGTSKSPITKALANQGATEWSQGANGPLGLPTFITRKLRLKRALMIPIIVNERSIGLHFVGRSEDAEFTAQEQIWFEQIAERVSKSFSQHAKQAAKAFTSKTI
jgi:HD-like signal output (HDOD) protein